MKYTNKHALPESFVQAVTNDPYDSGQSDISCTTLIAPPQIRILRKKHASDIVEDVMDRLWALFGQMGHALLERQTTLSAIKEKRLYATFLEWKLSGQFDNLTLIPEKILQDYKFTSTYAVKEIKPEWEAQLNVLNYLAKLNGHDDIKELQVVAMLRDWNRGMLLQNPDKYPKVPIKVMKVRMWSDKEVEKYIIDRIKIHQEAEKGKILPCTDEERWASPLCYKVMKDGNVRATKVFSAEFSDDPERDALTFIKNHKNGSLMEAVLKPREFKRCENYCDVAPFCSQFQGENNDN